MDMPANLPFTSTISNHRACRTGPESLHPQPMTKNARPNDEKLSYLHRLERRVSDATAYDLATEKGRKRARWNYKWLDHGILRKRWTNLDEIAPGVWRSNHPDRARLERYRDMGIRTVLTLRGESKAAFHVFEQEDCAALGLTLEVAKLSARALVTKTEMLHVLDVFERIEKPFVMHCKSGADRAGLASAMWMMHMEGQTVDQARSQLSFRYLHIRRSKTGILDYVLDAYDADTKTTPMSLREWVEERYEGERLTAAFHAARAEGRA